MALKITRFLSLLTIPWTSSGIGQFEKPTMQRIFHQISSDEVTRFLRKPHEFLIDGCLAISKGVNIEGRTSLDAA